MPPETFAVTAYASIEPAKAPKDAAAGRVLLEARLVWGADVLGVAHARVGAEVRVADLDLPAPGGDDIVVARAFDGDAALVTPNGARLPLGCRMTLRLGGARLLLALVDDDVPALPRPARDARLRCGVMGAAILHLAVLALLVHGRAGEGAISEQNAVTLKRMMSAAEDRAAAEVAASIAAAPAAATVDEDARAHDEKPDRGATGNPSRTNDAARARLTRRGAGVPSDPDDRGMVSTFGMIGMLTATPSDATGRSPFAKEDGPSTMGNVWGDTIGDAIGAAGLDLSGAGDGAGGFGAGVPLGAMTTLHAGEPDDHVGLFGSGSGCGCGHARLAGVHLVRAPRLTMSDPVVSGRLPPDAIQRVVRQNLGRMRGCYSEALVHEPTLEGRVAVRFVIDREGRVSVASADDRSLPSESVAGCVARAFQALEFPAPENGIVTVVYPLVFSPS